MNGREAIFSDCVQSIKKEIHCGCKYIYLPNRLTMMMPKITFQLLRFLKNQEKKNKVYAHRISHTLVGLQFAFEFA
jgi:hypothetical protein